LHLIPQRSLQQDYDRAFLPFCDRCQSLVDDLDWRRRTDSGGEEEMDADAGDAIGCVAQVFEVDTAVLNNSVAQRPDWAATMLDKKRVTRSELERTVAGFTVKVFAEYTKVP